MSECSMDALVGLFLGDGGFFDDGIAWEVPAVFYSFPRPTTQRLPLNFACYSLHRGQMAMPSDGSASFPAPARLASQVFPQMNTFDAFWPEVVNQHSV